jgi:hypothetical protein
MEQMKMGIWHYLILIIFISLISGCDEITHFLSPSRYHRENIVFFYPRNWKVTEDVARRDFRYLFIESPDGAIVIIHIYLKDRALDLRDFVDEFAGKTEREIPLGKVDNNYISTVVRKTTSGSKTGIRERFALMIKGMQIPYVREYVRMEVKNKAIFLISQVAAENMDSAGPGFDLILKSFTLD